MKERIGNDELAALREMGEPDSSYAPPPHIADALCARGLAEPVGQERATEVRISAEGRKYVRDCDAGLV